MFQNSNIATTGQESSVGVNIGCSDFPVRKKKKHSSKQVSVITFISLFSGPIKIKWQNERMKLSACYLKRLKLNINFLQLQRSHTHVEKCLAFHLSHSFDNNSREKSRNTSSNAFSFPQNLACFSSHPILHLFFSLVFLTGMFQLFFPSPNIQISLQKEDMKLHKRSILLQSRVRK